MSAESPLKGWPLPPEHLCLREDEVHVWGVELEQYRANIQDFFETLAADERRRAGRFHFERDRAHFVIARGVLRDILGRYLSRLPARIRFGYGPQGKPALAETSGRPPLEFNVSHSRGLALYAFAQGREVGLDVEYVREDFASEEVARQFFSARELAALGSLPKGTWTRAFFNCWTRKEAYIKATGAGLSCPLSSFSVSLDPERLTALTWVEGDASEVARWSACEIGVGTRYAAAAVVRGAGWGLRCWRWG